MIASNAIATARITTISTSINLSCLILNFPPSLMLLILTVDLYKWWCKIVGLFVMRIDRLVKGYFGLVIGGESWVVNRESWMPYYGGADFRTLRISKLSHYQITKLPNSQILLILTKFLYTHADPNVALAIKKQVDAVIFTNNRISSAQLIGKSKARIRITVYTKRESMLPERKACNNILCLWRKKNCLISWIFGLRFVL